MTARQTELTDQQLNQIVSDFVYDPQRVIDNQEWWHVQFINYIKSLPTEFQTQRNIVYLISRDIYRYRYLHTPRYVYKRIINDIIYHTKVSLDDLELYVTIMNEFSWRISKYWKGCNKIKNEKAKEKRIREQARIKQEDH
jgi:hypothetical protein